MSRKLFPSVLAFLATGAWLLGTAQAQDESPPDARAPAAGAVNHVCPIRGEPVDDSAVIVEFHGEKVALCCAKCRKTWDGLDDAERAKRLEQVRAPGASEHTESAAVGDPYPLPVCPVSGKPLGGMGDPVVRRYGGREIRFCCEGCVARFERDKERYLADIDAKIAEDQRPRYPLTTCVVSGRELGAMGEPVEVVVGNRLVRLCCEGCKRRLERDPAEYLKKLDEAVVSAQGPDYPLKTCVVSGEPLDAMDKPLDVVVASRLVRLCCPGCLPKLRRAPATYLAALDKARAGAEAGAEGAEER